MNVGSLFSGIGGLDHGLAQAGWQHAFLCESDEWRRSILRERFPGVPVYEDVHALPDAHAGRNGERDVRGEETDGRVTGPVGQQDAASRVDLLGGGFPCQDVSVAGRRAGLAGVRSGLFHEFARIADAFQPRWLLVENVPGLLSSNGGRDFGVVLGTLADLGYGVAWRILDSRFFGVPQRRRRVFIVGAKSVGDPAAAAQRAGKILAVGQGCDRHSAPRGEARPDLAPALSGRSPSRLDDQETGQLVPEQHYYVEDFEDGTLTSSTGRIDRHPLIAAPLLHGSNPNSNMAGRRREDDENLVSFDAEQSYHEPDDLAYLTRKLRRAVSSAEQGVRRLTPTECERLQALPDGWTTPGPDSRRYAGLGDAVTASVGEWIGRRLLDEEGGSRLGPANPSSSSGSGVADLGETGSASYQVKASGGIPGVATRASEALL